MSSSSEQWGFKRQRCDWEVRDYESDSESDGGSLDSDDDTLDSTRCATMFRDMLISLKLSGVISAKHACVLSFWAEGAGIAKPGGELALHPKNTGGSFSAKFDKVIGMSQALNADFYRIPMVVHQPWSFGRAVVQREVSLLHELLSDEIYAEGQTMFWSKVEDAREKEGWVPSFAKHLLVQEHGPERIIPLTLNIDAVPFLKKILQWASGLRTWPRGSGIFLSFYENGNTASVGAGAGARFGVLYLPSNGSFLFWRAVHIRYWGWTTNLWGVDHEVSLLENPWGGERWW